MLDGESNRMYERITNKENMREHQHTHTHTIAQNVWFSWQAIAFYTKFLFPSSIYGISI